MLRDWDLTKLTQTLTHRNSLNTFFVESDDEEAYLHSLGFTGGSLNDKQSAYLESEGHTGSLPDKRKAYFANPVLTGIELIVDGDFPTTDNWIPVSATLTAIDNELRVIDAGSWSCAYQIIPTTIGSEYEITVEVSYLSVSSASLYWGSTEPDGATTYGDNQVFSVGDLNTYTNTFVATDTSTYISITSTDAGTAGYKGLTIQELVQK